MKTLTIPGTPSIQADLYQAEDLNPSITKKEKTILYFHGGGLLFGSRKDLPLEYIHLFLRAGYDLVCLDYPLAPEAKLPQIQESNISSVQYFLEEIAPSEGLSPDYLLFGRSAGAYLALSLANLLRRRNLPLPQKVLALYGYYRFSEKEFLNPSEFYNRISPVSEKSAFRRVNTNAITECPALERYALYIYGRQQGCWCDMVLSQPEDDLLWSVSPEELSLLPPTFLAAGTSDHDVPFRISRDLARKIPGSHFIPVYYQEHEFDKDPSLEEARDVYRQMIEWIEA